MKGSNKLKLIKFTSNDLHNLCHDCWGKKFEFHENLFLKILKRKSQITCAFHLMTWQALAEADPTSTCGNLEIH